MTTAPAHPTWPGWEADLATLRRGKALFQAFSTGTGPDSSRAYEAWQAMLPAYLAAEGRMEKAQRKRTRRAADA